MEAKHLGPNCIKLNSQFFRQKLYLPSPGVLPSSADFIPDPSLLQPTRSCQLCLRNTSRPQLPHGPRRHCSLAPPSLCPCLLRSDASTVGRVRAHVPAPLQWLSFLLRGDLPMPSGALAQPPPSSHVPGLRSVLVGPLPAPPGVLLSESRPASPPWGSPQRSSYLSSSPTSLR